MNDLEEIPGGINQSFSRGSSTIIFSQVLSQGNPLHIDETIFSKCIPVWSSRSHVTSASLPKGPIIYTPALELISIFYLQTYLLWQILQYSKMLFPGTSNLGHSNGFWITCSFWCILQEECYIPHPWIPNEDLYYLSLVWKWELGIYISPKHVLQILWALLSSMGACHVHF